MRLIILLGAAAIALSFIISFVASSKRAGTAVSARFLERSNKIPPQAVGEGDDLDADSLKDWIGDRKTAGYAKTYAWQVIPADFVYLIVLGCFLALGATTLASTIVWPAEFPKLPFWTWWIFPVIYMLADAGEDSMIVLLLSIPSAITHKTVRVLALLRNIKIASNIVATAQVFLLGAASFIWK